MLAQFFGFVKSNFFKILTILELFCIIFVSVMQTIASQDEESPSIQRTWCRLTACGGDPKESATEINRQNFGKDGKVV